MLNYGLDADYVGDSVYAKMLAETGKLILSDDWYPTTELYVIHHQLIMTPLFHIFDDYSVVYTITTAIAFILIAFTYYYFMRSFIASKIKSLLAVLLICNPVNSLFVQYSIAFHGYLFFVILATLYVTILFKLIYKSINTFEKVMLMIIAFLGGICGIRLFLLVFVPLCIVLILKSRNIRFNKEMLKISEILKNKKIITIVCSYALAFLGFLIFYFVLMPRFGGGHEFGAAGTSNLDISNNIKDLVLIILNSIGFNIHGTRVISITFIKSFIILIFWSYVLFKNITLALKRNEDKALQSLSFFSVICMVTTLLFMIFTIGNDQILYSLRYFGLAMYLVIPIAVMNLEKINNTLKSIIIYAFLLLIIVIGLDSQLDSIRTANNVTNVRQGYVDFIDKSEYSFGAATYWNANITTFMSEKQIEIKPVIDSTDLNLYKWNTKKSYENREPEFLILTIEEYDKRVENELENEVVYQDDNYIIIEL